MRRFSRLSQTLLLVVVVACALVLSSVTCGIAADVVVAEEGYCEAGDRSCEGAGADPNAPQIDKGEDGNTATMKLPTTSFMEEAYQAFAKSVAQAIEEQTRRHKPCRGFACYESSMWHDFDAWRGGFTRQKFEDGLAQGIHYQIVKGKVYRQEKCNFPARCEGIEHFLLKVAAETPNMDNVEFVVNVNDQPRIPVEAERSKTGPAIVFSFSKPRKQFADIMYPAWTFWSGGPAVWPIEPTGLGRWDLKREALAASAAKSPWEDKKKLLFFRGSRTSAERDALVVLSRKDPEVADAAYTKNQAYKSPRDTLGKEPAEMVRLEDHCEYAYLANFRGVAASFRHKHLFLCGSLVLHFGDQRDDWLEFYYPAMRPWVHYVPVSQDSADLELILRWVREHDEEAKAIAQRGQKFVIDNLNMDDVSIYWKELLTAYGNRCDWQTVRNETLLQI